MRKYRLVAKKGEGTFSEVLKAQNIKDNKYHAIKCMKNHFESILQVNNLREIQALRRLSPHPNIVTLEEVLYDAPSGRLALVFELMDANLYEIIRGRRHYLKPELIQSFMYQLMKAMDHMHNKGIFHRDIKPENILVDNSTELKLADFGSCRGIYSKQPYTEYISTRWYRAPECLLTDGYYGSEMDLWGIGCVFFEITSLYPLFPGNNELDQISRIHQILGTPTPAVLEIFQQKGAAHLDFNAFEKLPGTKLSKLIPHASPEAVDLMDKMLSYDPNKRITSRQALQHPYFTNLREKEKIAPQVTITGKTSNSIRAGPETKSKPLPHLRSNHPSKTIQSLQKSQVAQKSQVPQISQKSQVAQKSQANEPQSKANHHYQSSSLPPISTTSCPSTVKKKTVKNTYGSYGSSKVRNGYRNVYHHDAYGSTATTTATTGSTYKTRTHPKKKTTTTSKTYGNGYGKYGKYRK